jgi:hypothetical protein
MDDHRSRKHIDNFPLISRVALTAIIGEVGEFVAGGEMAQNVIAAQLPPGIERKKLSRFHPKNLH